MGFAGRIATVAAVIAVAGLALASAEPIKAAMTGEAAIKARVHLMKENGKNMKAIQGFVKSGKGTAAEVAKHAAGIAADAKKIPSLFPKDTGRGHFTDKQTRALPAIWTDWKGFEKDSHALMVAAEHLEKVAKAGDKDAIAKAAGGVGKACGACHKAYRGPEVD